MTPDNTLLTHAGLLCLALASALLGREQERRVAAAGLVILGLALAAWHAGSSPDAGLTSPGRLGRGFVVGNAGLLLLGTVLVGAAALRVAPGRHRAAARLLVAAGLVLLGPVLLAFLLAGGPVRAVGAGLGVGLVGGALALGARAIAARAGIRAAVQRLAPPPLEPLTERPARAIATLAIGTAAAAVGPHLAVVFLGLTLATWLGYLAFHPTGARPVPVAPVLTLLLLPAYLLLATVAGPLGLGVAILPQIPVSPAAELLVTPALLVAAWVTTGLWPLQRQLPGALLAPVGALLLARVAWPLVPGGLEYWRPVIVPLVVLGLWNAAGYGRWPLALAGSGFLGIVGGAPHAIAGGAALLAVGLALELCGVAAGLTRVTMLAVTVAWPLAAWAGVRMLEGALRGEVVYTALGALGVALMVAAGRADAGEARSRAR